jgi:hypothetical protein
MPTPSTPTLVGLDPGPLAGRRFDLADGHLVLGREHGCGLYLGDPHVSPRHAAVTVQRGRTWVEDLGSAEGTFVNGHPLRGSHELRPGDVVTFAVIRMRYEVAPAAAVRFDVRHQNGGAIHNVGGDQYHHYQYIQQQRDGLLRDVAATKTRARWLIVFGVVVVLAGFTAFAAGVLGFMTEVADAVTSGNPSPPSTSPFGRPVFGIPSGLIGWACAVIGSVMVILGIVFHVVATARRRRVDREMPPMPPSYR